MSSNGDLLTWLHYINKTHSKICLFRLSSRAVKSICSRCHFKASTMSKEFSTPEDITQTVVDEEAFGGYTVETLVTPELFYTEDMVKAEYDKMFSAEKTEFQEGVKAAEAYQKAYGHCAPWEYTC